MEKLITFIVVIVGWVFSLCLHEFSHALVAYYGGDTTVKDKGYLTFNPIKYTHPIYSIVLPVVFLLLGGIGLPGGAVYIETWRLRSRRWETAVSLAGPAANLLVAVVLSLALHYAPLLYSAVGPGLACLALLQVSALFLNLFPVPPFDGYHALAPHLAPEVRARIDYFGNFIMIIIFIALWNIPIVNDVFWSVVYAICNWLQVPTYWAYVGLNQFLLWR